MSIASFDELHEKLKGVLQDENTQFRNCIKSKLKQQDLPLLICK